MAACSSCSNLMIVRSDEASIPEFLKYVCGHPLHRADDCLPAMLGRRKEIDCNDHEMGRAETVDVPLSEWRPLMDDPTFSKEARETYRDLGIKYRRVKDVG